MNDSNKTSDKLSQVLQKNHNGGHNELSGSRSKKITSTMASARPVDRKVKHIFFPNVYNDARAMTAASLCVHENNNAKHRHRQPTRLTGILSCINNSPRSNLANPQTEASTSCACKQKQACAIHVWKISRTRPVRLARGMPPISE